MSDFLISIVEATADLTSAYKLNLGFFEQYGPDGLDELERVRASVPSGIPVVADAKRGDIGHTAAAYARAIFEAFGFDACTVSPYLGEDSIAPFLEYQDRGVIILCRTSNPGASNFQDLRCVQADGRTRPLFETIAIYANSWNRHSNVGLVTGATYPEELRQIRQLVPSLPFLIPGIGTQGGDLASAIRFGPASDGTGPLINIGRQIIYADEGPNFAAAARRVAEYYHRQIKNRKDVSHMR